MIDQDQKRAIAEQVIVSAGDVLVAAGFRREEIGEFFRQAADQLAPSSAGFTAPASLVRADMAPVYAAFHRSKPVGDLQPLIARARALSAFTEEDSTALKTGFDLAMQMVPLLAEAQNALRALAKEASLPLYASREEWMDSAGTSDLSNAPPAICLEDFAPAYLGAFEAIGWVLVELVRREDAETFTFLLGHLAENGVVIDADLRASIEKGAQLLPG